MKIIKESIIDISKDFEELEKSLQGCNYVVNLNATIFNYTENDNFTLNDLKFIFNNDVEINGIIKEEKWQEAFDKINSYLKYEGDSYYDPNNYLNVVTDKIHKERIDNFWDIVKKHIHMAPQKILVHIPEYSSYFFSDYVMWNFCYIFLNNGKGLVLHAGASD